MIFRARQSTQVGKKLYHGSQVKVICAHTGEQLASVYEADTKEGCLYSYVMDKRTKKILKEKTIRFPDGSSAFPLRINKTYRPFKIVDRKTGKVIARSHRL